MTGHEWAVELLTSGLRNGRLAHAFLLTGPAQIGKTTLARAFAQTLNCETGSPVPCQRCRACRLIAQDGHPDVWLIKPEPSSSGRTETLRIEQVRGLQKDLALAPYEGRYRVAILTRFHRASPGAANALLKTLEEPPDRVKLILTADQADGLLPTILSRCQLLSLRLLPVEQVEAALLVRWKASKEQASRLAHLSGGRLGLAVRLLSSPRLDEQRAKRLDTLERLLETDRTGRFEIVGQITQQKGAAPVQETLELWSGWWRDVMLTAGRSGKPASITNLDRQDRIQAAASRYGMQAASAAVQAIRQTLWQIEHNANIRLAVEVLTLNLPF